MTFRNDSGFFQVSRYLDNNFPDLREGAKGTVLISLFYLTGKITWWSNLMGLQHIWRGKNEEERKRTSSRRINYNQICLKKYPKNKQFKFIVSTDDETINSSSEEKRYN